MLNAEDDQCEHEDTAADFGEKGNEIFSTAKAGSSCGDGSGQYPGCGGECRRLDCASAIISAVDYVVQINGVKKQNAEEKKRAQEDRGQAGVFLGEEACAEGEQNCAGDVGENGATWNPGRNDRQASLEMSVDEILNAKNTDGNCEKDAAEIEQSVD